MIKILRAGFATIVLSSAAYAAGVTCPADRLSMHFTGNTQVVSGTLPKEYRCAQGYTAWSR